MSVYPGPANPIDILNVAVATSSERHTRYPRLLALLGPFLFSSVSAGGTWNYGFWHGFDLIVTDYAS